MRGGREVHQFLASMGFRDAVGTHTLETRRALAVAGLTGGIWAEDIQSEMGKDARPCDVYPSIRSSRRRASTILYQA
ncbi:MAG: hypothetical protein LC733_05875, partial [Actinobacteria bacterium]|nr:hypothetical protein [Actinomycetota bacterium]